MPRVADLRRWRLTAVLRRFRDQPGLPVSDVADRLNWVGLRISRIDTRELGVTVPDLRFPADGKWADGGAG